MSLILEALRKSEAERRRGSAPDVSVELPPAATARARAMPAWLPPALVFGAVILLAAWWWWRRDPPSATPATTVAAPATTDSVAPAIVQRIQRQAAAPPATSATPVPVPPPVIASSQPPLAVAEPAPSPARPLPVPPAAPAAVDAIDIDATSVPSVKLSMHMWDESPSKRFVILDGQRMGEGDRNGDLAVVAIERDGVVVERNGQRARVPLP